MLSFNSSKHKIKELTSVFILEEEQLNGVIMVGDSLSISEKRGAITLLKDYSKEVSE